MPTTSWLWLRRLVSNCAIKMSWATDKRKSRGMANGVRKKSNCCHRKDCRLYGCMPGRDITRQWNRTSKVLLLLALVLCVGGITCVPGRAQEPAKQDQSKPSSNEQSSTESQDKD